MRGVPFGFHPSAGSGIPTGYQVRSAPRIHQQHYSRLLTVPLQQAFTSNVGVHGKATIHVGPNGVGARWYPAQVQVTTTTGISDGSMCTIYLNVELPTAQLAQTVQGGQDTMGVSVPGMQPGERIFAVWTGANPGDTATLIVIGDQDVVTT